jgi:uncharacterized membrane protein YphA (DoxX/SURF4 family)
MPVFSRLKIFQRESEQLSILAMRFGVGSMFLWFGMDKWAEPEMWFGWVPLWMMRLPVQPQPMMIFIGMVEFCLGLALLTGRRLRLVSAVCAAALLFANLMIGVSDSTVRDAAVLGCLLSLMIHANAKARRPWGTETIAVICTAYVFLLFLCGVAFLRAA